MNKLVALVIVALLAACNSAVAEPSAFSGKWNAPAKADYPFVMTATVEDGLLEIWYSDGALRSLYWKGTAPEEIRSGESFISLGDTEAMDASLLGSQLEEKEFTYEDDMIKYTWGIMGMEYDIELARDKNV